MWRFCPYIPIRAFTVLVFVAALLPAAEPAKPGPDAAVAAEAGGLVDRLGDPAFEVRRTAAQRLSALGLAAQEALQAGLKHADPHVRRQCRWILSDVLVLDYKRRVAAFLADKEDAHSHDMPCWERFKQLVGGDAEAKKLFVEMLEAEGPLLETAAAGNTAAEAIGDAILLRSQYIAARASQVVHVAVGLPGNNPAMPVPSGSVAAILFLLGDPELRLSPEARENHMLMNWFHQSGFRAVAMDPKATVPRKLLGRWLVSPGSLNMLNQRLHLAAQFQMPEALDLAKKFVSDDKFAAGNPHLRAQAIGVIGQVGGKSHAAMLVPLLGDSMVLFQMGVAGGQQPRVCQLRDVALAWLLYLTGEDFAEYGMPQAKGQFEQMQRILPQPFMNFANLGYQDPNERDKALAKWKSRVAQKPLPPLPPGRAPVEIQVTPFPLAVAAARPAVRAARLPGGKEEPAPPASMKLERADRQQVQALAQARELCRQEHYAEGVRLLDEILAAGEDRVFQASPQVPVFRCLKAEAERILQELPEEGRAEYRLQFDAASRKMLADALRCGQPQAIAAVAQRFFHTAAGAEAAYVVGLYWRDRSQPFRAALYWSRLQQASADADRLEPLLSLELADCYVSAGMVRQAEACLRRLAGRWPQASVRVAGRLEHLPAGVGQALPWLEALLGRKGRAEAEGWLMYCGNPARNAASDVGSPLVDAREPLGAVSTGPLRAKLDELQHEQLEQRRPAIPQLYPLVIGQTAVVRTATHLAAFDLGSRKLLWDAPPEDSMAAYLQAKPAESQPLASEAIARGLKRRFWADANFGTPSSDGQSVFLLENVYFGFGPEYQRIGVGPDGRRRIEGEAFEKHNLLCAYDLATGKLRWEIGGPPGPSQLPLAGTLFLGSPLPLAGRLYVPAELGRETQLLELDARTGELVAGMTLSLGEAEPVPPQPFFVFNGMAGPHGQPRPSASPSFAEGILVCQVGENQYAGLDLASRNVRWVCQLPEPEDGMTGPMRMNPWLRQQRALLQVEDLDRWLDAPPTIAGGRVLLAPRNSNELVCLSLADGQPLWTAPRRDGLYLAGVEAGLALVVGRSHFWALRMTDGQPAWNPERIPLPDGQLPGGHGLLGQGRYYLPLSSGEIAVFDLAAGKLAARARTAAGLVPGNLVACRDGVLAQNTDGVWCFDTIQVHERQLADPEGKHRDDPAWHRRCGELALSDGRPSEAFEHFRRSLALATTRGMVPDPQTRQLLADALGEGLRTDPKQFIPAATRLEAEIPSGEGRVALLRALGRALAESGEQLAALRTYLKLLDAETQPDQTQPIDASCMVARGRWTAARIAEVLAAGTAQRPALDRLVAERLGDERLREFIAAFAAHPLAQEARLRLAGRVSGLEAEQLLRDVAETAPPAQGAEVTARLAALLRQAKRPEAAACCYRLLAGPLATETCRDGRTGRQVTLEACRGLPPDDPLRLAIDLPCWPRGKVKVASSNQTPGIVQRWGVPVRVDERFDEPLVCEADPAGRKLLVFGANGDLRWQLESPETQDFQFMHMQYGYAQVWRRGHLLVAWLGTKICAFDVMSDPPKRLWQCAATRPLPPQLAVNALMFMRPRGMLGGQSSAGDPLPLVVAASGVYFLYDGEVRALDAASGKLLWKHDGLPAGSNLLGDGRIVLVVPREEGEATVLAADDGRELGHRPLPAPATRQATLGRQLVVGRETGQSYEVSLVDPWLQKTPWQRQFPKGTQVRGVGSDELAVLDPSGHLTILGLPEGRDVLAAQLPLPENFDRFYVLRSRAQYVVAASATPVANVNVFMVNNGAMHVPVNGVLHGLDRATGARTWSAQVKDYNLRLDQPPESPVLVLSATLQVIEQRGAHMAGKLLCLNRRNGKMLYETEMNNPQWQWMPYTPQVDPRKHTVDLCHQQGSVQLTFTDER
jgi:outer membrane protein assembly factor BamB